MTNFDGKRALLAGRDDKMDLNLQIGVQNCAVDETQSIYVLGVKLMGYGYLQF